MKILVIEDEADVLDVINSTLTLSGFQVIGLASGENIIAELLEHTPDLVLLDHRLPGVSGVEVLRKIRQHGKLQRMPVIMVTGVCGEDEKVEALNGGADDYVTKPFLPRELIARIHAVKRRVQERNKEPSKLICGHITIDLAAHRVLLNGTELALTLTEFRILSELLHHIGQVLTRDRLRQRALGNLNVTDRTIDVHMASLRKKLAEQGEKIQTVRGVGYRFTD